MKSIGRMKVTSHVSEFGPGGQWFWVRKFMAMRQIDADGQEVYYALYWSGGGMKMDPAIVEHYYANAECDAEAALSDEMKSSIHDAYYGQLFTGMKKKLDQYGIALNDDGSVMPPDCPQLTNGSWQDFPKVRWF